jgi:hypothetical protein
VVGVCPKLLPLWIWQLACLADRMGCCAGNGSRLLQSKLTSACCFVHRYRHAVRCGLGGPMVCVGMRHKLGYVCARPCAAIAAAGLVRCCCCCCCCCCWDRCCQLPSRHAGALAWQWASGAVNVGGDVVAAACAASGLALFCLRSGCDAAGGSVSHAGMDATVERVMSSSTIAR